MNFKDVFSIEGQGTVVNGKIRQGKIKLGVKLKIVGVGKDKEVVVKGILHVSYLST
jgi:translation elongation factor EF-Tu-like GTPase